jgi:hypothetical protein
MERGEANATPRVSPDARPAPPRRCWLRKRRLGHDPIQTPVSDLLLERAVITALNALSALAVAGVPGGRKPGGGLLIAIDDAQWLDEDSRRLIEVAVVSLSGADARVRWLVAARTEAPAGQARVPRLVPGAIDNDVDAALALDILQASPPDPMLRFSHPLLREAAVGLLTDPQRRVLHMAIAAALAPADSHESAWHRAQAATEPDEELAGHLDLAAQDAGQRGARAHAVTLSGLAIALTPDPGSLEAWRRRLVWLALLTAAEEYEQARHHGRQWADIAPKQAQG